MIILDSGLRRNDGQSYIWTFYDFIKFGKQKMKETNSVKNGLKKKTVKDIKVNVDKCTGCRACELACSAFHAMPKYSSTNPAKARIRVMVDEFEDVYVPIRAGYYSPVECTGRYAYTINGKTYTECGFCKVACPSRTYFMEPDSGLPLRCDMCKTDPPLKEPMCVQVCPADALTYTEREEVGDETVAQEELDVGLKRLAEKHGLQKIVRILDRMSKTGKTLNNRKSSSVSHPCNPCR